MRPSSLVRGRWQRSLTALSAVGLLCQGLTGCATTSSVCSSSGGECVTCEAPTPVYENGECGAGCSLGGTRATQCSLSNCDAPRELNKVSLPEYMVEPPDVLLIEVVHNIRPAHAPVHAGEPLLIQVNRTIPLAQVEEAVSAQFKQINGVYVIGTDGYVNLGPEYGKVLVAEQPIAEIQRRVEEHMQQILTNPQVLVTLPMPQNKQLVTGPHLVRPDGTVSLGIYGSVYVTGLTLQQARSAIEQHLSQYIHRPEVNVDVLAYNSKVYYVITDGGGAGEGVYRIPTTGNETVLDAVAGINGLPTVASKAHIWIARPSPQTGGPDQILQVDWNAIAQGAQTETNYQLLPGDRLYVKASPWITLDTKLAKVTAPLERVLGFTILGNGTTRALKGEDVNGF